MGKLDSVSLRSEQLILEEIGAYHLDMEEALRLLFSRNTATFQVRFFAMTQAEIDAQLSRRIEELDVTCVFSLLAKIEAAFRVDYLIRCRARRRDRLTKLLRPIYSLKKQEARLEDDILDQWKSVHPEFRHLIGEIKGALIYRHWVAHGRYWNPKLARMTNDFTSIYSLAKAVLQTFPLHEASI